MVSRWDVTRAVRKSGLPSAARLVMFVLADVADNETAIIPVERTPSLTTLANETGLGRSTVARELKQLEKDKWVQRKRPTKTAAWGKKARTQYRLDIPAAVREALELDEMTSPTVGLVPDVDQSLVPQRDQSNAQVGLRLVPQRDCTSPTAGHVVTPLTPSKTSTNSSLARAAKPNTPRGIRIPVDFKVTPDMVEWARTDTPDVDGRRETERFTDYWRAQPGQKGVKTDWPATWRNWMRKAQDDARPVARSSPGTNGYRGPFRNPTDPNAYTEGL